ncbi:thermonuclease family protein [Niabella sp. CJ426]|uniref:thermonuclease family protein n=1 Tax=Niabella sp. CJ426 TaxID=3393740 RepID=UPI003D014FC7
MSQIYKICFGCFFFTILFVPCSNPEEELHQSGLFYTAASSNHRPAQLPTYKVIGIKDGDTFAVLMDGKEQVVRLAHIDCREKKQPFGARAKAFVSDRTFGRYVSLAHNDKYDRNHRLIAEVILSDRCNLNKELVKNGLAWHFKKHSDDTIYANLENKARQARVGVWKDRNPVAPWEWRRARHTANTAH